MLVFDSFQGKGKKYAKNYTSAKIKAYFASFKQVP